MFLVDPGKLSIFVGRILFQTSQCCIIKKLEIFSYRYFPSLIPHIIPIAICMLLLITMCYFKSFSVYGCFNQFVDCFSLEILIYYFHYVYAVCSEQ